MIKFKVGDKIICETPVGNKQIQNCIGTILYISYLYDNHIHDMAIEFEQNISGHSCEGRGKNFHCWWCDTANHKIKLICVEYVGIVNKIITSTILQLKDGSIVKTKDKNRYKINDIININDYIKDKIIMEV